MSHPSKDRLDDPERLAALLRAVLDGTVFAIIATRPDGVIESFNAGAE
ncbi:MAG TPA: hypothetical protein VGA56_07060 [Opitutaceae bacterium]